MNNEVLKQFLFDKSDEWRAGFFAAINLNGDMKAAFLRGMIGERVEVEFAEGHQMQENTHPLDE